MRDAAERKFRFNFNTLKQYNLSLVALIVTLFSVSLYSVNTASVLDTSMAYLRGEMSPMIVHVGKMVIAFGILVGCAFIPARQLRVPTSVLYVAFCLLLVCLMPFFGKTLNGATRWIRIPGIPMDIQPSEFIKLALIMIYAFFASQGSKVEQKTKAELFLYYGVPTILALIFVLPIALQNLSTGVIFGLFIILYLFVLKMPIRLWLKILVSSLIIALVSVGILMAIPRDYIPENSRFYTAKLRLERKADASDEERFKIDDHNMQEQYGRIALANSRLFIGQGVGGSKMKDILPMANSDYVYAVLIEELGLIALIGVPALYVWWFVLAGVLARREKNTFLQFLLYGIGIIFPLQALVNIVVVSGVFTTGQPLPFLSAGGSSLLASSIALGLMLSISKRQYERRQEERDAKAKIAIHDGSETNN